MSSPSRKKVNPPTAPDQEDQTQQNLNLASNLTHTTTRTSTHRATPPSYATLNATLDETILEGHRRLRKSLDDMKAKLQRQEAAKQTGRECS